MLNYVTENWRRNFVTCDLSNRQLLEPFTRRPFFLILQCDAPLMERFRRSQRCSLVIISSSGYLPSYDFSSENLSLVDFIGEDDRINFGDNNELHLSKTGPLKLLAGLVDITIMNAFPTIQDLHKYLDNLDIVHTEHLRPSWDSYFMVGLLTFDSFFFGFP